jgi:transcriptional regulator GlxA family with amidase domain
MNRQQMLQLVICLGFIAALLAGCGGMQVNPTATTSPLPPIPTPMTRLDGQRVLFVVYDHFSQSEFDIPCAILEDLGVVITIASSSTDTLIGSGGSEVQADLLLSEVHGTDYDAIVFVGGQGVEAGTPEAHRIAQEAAAEGSVVAAICSAQAILARAGLAEGKGVPTSSVERNDLIIRAYGPAQSREFGEAIAAAMGE